MTSELVQVVATGPTEDLLVRITQHLINQRLVACGHHLPIRSVYTWQGSVEDHAESRVEWHTRAIHVPAIIEAVKIRHPYEVPGIIAVPLTMASADYAAWIVASTTDSSTV